MKFKRKGKTITGLKTYRWDQSFDPNDKEFHYHAMYVREKWFHNAIVVKSFFDGLSGPNKTKLNKNWVLV